LQITVRKLNQNLVSQLSLKLRAWRYATKLWRLNVKETK